jgi:hypothetical protein
MRPENQNSPNSAKTDFVNGLVRLDIRHRDRADVPVVSVYCCHLKSKLSTRLDRGHPDYIAMKPHAQAIGAALSTIRRTAEAAALRVILDKAMKGRHTPTVVIGDLNDGRLSNTLNIVTDQPSYRAYANSRTANRNDDGLYSAVTIQQFRSLSDVYYTHDYKGVREVLDHVLVSEQFYEHSQNRHWAFHEMKVWNDFIEDDDPSTSDHGLMRTAFDWFPAYTLRPRSCCLERFAEAHTPLVQPLVHVAEGGVGNVVSIYLDGDIFCHPVAKPSRQMEQRTTAQRPLLVRQRTGVALVVRIVQRAANTSVNEPIAVNGNIPIQSGIDKADAIGMWRQAHADFRARIEGERQDIRTWKQYLCVDGIGLVARPGVP